MEVKDRETLIIQLLGQTLQLKCQPEAKENLTLAAEIYKNKLAEIRNRSQHMSEERLAHLTGLTLAYELLQLKDQKNEYLMQVEKRVKLLQAQIREVLETS